jgi:hypothetical protein
MVSQAVLFPPTWGSKLVRLAGGRRSLFIALGALAAFAALAALPAANVHSNRVIAFVIGPLFFLALATTHALAHSRQARDEQERRYWLDLVLGLGTWTLVCCTNLLSSLELLDRAAIVLYVEFGYALSYVFIVAALETRPHDLDPSAEAGRRTPAWYAAILVAGLFSTLVLLPELANPIGNSIYFSPFMLYTAMDLYIACRAFYFARETSSRRWRFNFASLGFAFSLMLASDLTTVWLKRQPLPLTAGDARDALWLLPFAGLFLAGAAGGFGLEDRRQGPRAPTLSDAFAAPPLTWALFFPVFHFAADRLDWLDPSLAAPRDLVVMTFTLLLLGLAVRQQRRIEKGLVQLVRERREIEEELKESENDLRLLLHRSLAAEHLRAAEERYSKTLGASALMNEAASPENARRDRVAALFEGARLPLRLFAGSRPEEEFFANREARRQEADDGRLASVEQGDWRLVFGDRATKGSP